MLPMACFFVEIENSINRSCGGDAPGPACSRPAPRIRGSAGLWAYDIGPGHHVSPYHIRAHSKTTARFEGQLLHYLRVFFGRCDAVRTFCQSDQPSRYVRCKYWFAFSSFVNLRFGPSQWSCCHWVWRKRIGYTQSYLAHMITQLTPLLK